MLMSFVTRNRAFYIFYKKAADQLRQISKSHTHLQILTTTTANFQKDSAKIEGVASTRNLTAYIYTRI